MSTRAQQLDALLDVLVWLEEHSEVPMPIDFDGSPYARDYGGFSFHFTDRPDAKKNLALMARALPGKVVKDVRGGGDSDYFDLTGRVAGIRLHAIAYRDEVCERVVIGTREVTEEVLDPSVEVPTITVTKTVEDVEWRCAPVLA